MPSPADSEIRLAIIGTGKISRVHSRSIAVTAGARLVAVAGSSPRSPSVEALAGRYGARTSSVDDVFSADDVDAVVICSPTRFHVEQIVGAVGGGKAVLVEKPVDLDLRRVDECIAAVGASAARVLVGFNRRFDPSFVEVKARLDAGEIGSPQQLTIISRDPAPAPLSYLADSGGLFRDMSIHDLDMARYLLGDIVEVHAVGQRLDPAIDGIGDLSGAAITLTAASGAVATVFDSRSNSSGYDQRLELFGTAGALAVGNPTATTVRHSNATRSDAAGPYVDFYIERYTQAYEREMAYFVDRVRDGEPMSPSLRDGREALALADAADQRVRG